MPDLKWLEELEELEKAATPGPWEADEIAMPDSWNYWEITDADGTRIIMEADNTGLGVEQEGNNLKLVAAVRNALPRLLAIARATDRYIRAERCDNSGTAPAEFLDELRAALEGK